MFSSHTSKQRLSAFVLTSLLSLGIGSPSRTIAAPVKWQSPIAQAQPQQLRSSLVRAIRRDLSRRTGIPTRKLRIVEAQRRTWSDRCLGLPAPNQICAQALTPGWQIVVTNGQQRWTYRSDRSGKILRLVTSLETKMKAPKAIADAVLQDLSRRTGSPSPSFRIIEAGEKTWPDGCLGLAGADEFCTQALVSGWRVVVTDGTQEWIYRTSNPPAPIQVRLEKASQKDAEALKPVQIPTDELPPPLEKDEIFRAIAFGGFAGRTYETTLLADGRILRTQLTPQGAPTQTQTVVRISKEQVQQFQKLLGQQQFTCFDRLSYPAPPGAADFFTITLSSPDSTVSYVDLGGDRLPQALQNVIQAWGQLETGSN